MVAWFFLLQLYINFVGAQLTARTRHVAVPMGSDTAILFGGVTPESEEIRNDVWTYRALDDTWEPFEAIGDIPDPRAGATATSVNNNFWLLFGGSDQRQTFNDIYLFATEPAAWLRGIHVSHRRIPPRTDHAAATDGSGNVYVFGGTSADGRRLGDLWRISLLPDTLLNRGEDFSLDVHFYSKNGNPQDSELQMTGTPPTPRSGHSMTFVKDAMYLFGGSASAASPECGEIYKLNIDPQGRALWTQLPISPPCPTPREGHATARYGNSLLVLGGCNTHPRILKCYNDIWLYDTESNTWTDLRNDIPWAYTPRMGHTATFIPGGRLIIAGGSRLNMQTFGSVPSIQLPSGCPSDCSGGQGRCTTEKRCLCDKSYFEHDCGAIAFLGTNVDESPCNNHGAMQRDGRCECYLGYHGAACEFGTNTCLNSCSGHGRCNAQSQCECEPGYMDIDCSFLATCPNLCCHQGHCEASGRCTCHTGRLGASCSVTSLQVAEMRKSIEHVRNELQLLLSELGETETLSEERLAYLSAASSTAASEKALEAHVLDIQQRVQQQLSGLSLDVSDDVIAAKYFHESECISASVPPLLSKILPAQAPTLQAGGLQSGIISTGSSSYEQNQLAIEQSRRDGRKSLVFPPGPGGIAIDAVYDIATYQQHIASGAPSQLSSASLGIPPAPQLGAISQPTTPGPTLPSLSPLANSSSETKATLFTLLLGISCASTYGVHYTNKRIKGRQSTIEQPFDASFVADEDVMHLVT